MKMDYNDINGNINQTNTALFQFQSKYELSEPDGKLSFSYLVLSTAKVSRKPLDLEP